MAILAVTLYLCAGWGWALYEYETNNFYSPAKYEFVKAALFWPLIPVAMLRRKAGW